jgi:hypothetical protein
LSTNREDRQTLTRSAPPGRHKLDEPGAIPFTVHLTRGSLHRWLPLAFAVGAVTAVLLSAGTPVLDLVKYAGYAVLAVALPGTLVYRALRRNPRTLVEDLAMGVAVGLCLELAAWACYSALDLRGWVWTWPLAVVVPFAAIPRLRGCWLVRGYEKTPLAWSWSVSGVVTFFTVYLAAVFLDRNPIVPTSEDTRQYLDLAYQLSLAGEAKHRIPPHLPQVANEPLYYHWFGHAHMAMTSMVGHIDLTVVSLRLAVPGLCIAAIVLSAVVGWRLSGRPLVGVVTAVLFWVVGEVNFTHPVTQPFGTQAAFVIWHGMSMTYSWVLLIALIGALGATLAGNRTYSVVALLALGSSGAKASSLPVVLLALLFTGAVLLLTTRRVPKPLLVSLAIVFAAQLFATAVLFRFHTYGLRVDPFGNLRWFWRSPAPVPHWLLVSGVVAAFVINMQARMVGIVSLLWVRRLVLSPVEWFLLGGALAGPGLYLAFGAISAEYFTRAGFTFGVVLSAIGFVLVLDRARLSMSRKVLLAFAATSLAVLLVVAQLLYAGPDPGSSSYSALVPILKWSAVLATIGVLVALAWNPATLRFPGLRRRGGLVLLTAILVAGAPGLAMDMYKSVQNPNGGAYYNIVLPRSRVEAARWVRDHSRPTDVLATNAHCLSGTGPTCDARSFWLSAYSERSVLVEGWSFAPRLVESATGAFWDPALLDLNDLAFYAPSPELLAELRHRYHVRWLVVDREVGRESNDLSALARLGYTDGRMAVYELG